jgi:hypothetical protein
MGAAAERTAADPERCHSGWPVSQDERAAGLQGDDGDDRAKTLSGRKRHLLVDTLGLVLGLLAHSANIQDRASAPWLLHQVQPLGPRLELI